MRRVLTIVAALSSLLIVPVLCVGGVILHTCECAEEICCPPECDCDGPTGCGHESGCSDDPCSTLAVRTESQNAGAVAVFHPAVSTPIILISVTQPSVQTECAAAHEWPCGKTLPFAPSDRPLVI